MAVGAYVLVLVQALQMLATSRCVVVKLVRTVQRAEVRARGIATLAVLDRWDGVGDTDAVTELWSLADLCIGERSGRPSFREIVARVGDPEGV